MIAIVRGRLAVKEPDGTVVVDTGAVGYRVFVSLNTLVQLPDVGGEVALYTVSVVREDAFHLYGFGRTEERDLFNLLTQVKGVGPRLALALLGGLKTSDLKAAISRQDPVWISTVPGVGMKTAERIVLELKDKVTPTDGEDFPAVDGVDEQTVRDVVSALTNLGYRAAEGRRAVKAVLKREDRPEDFEGLIRESLKLMSGRGAG